MRCAHDSSVGGHACHWLLAACTMRAVLYVHHASPGTAGLWVCALLTLALGLCLQRNARMLAATPGRWFKVSMKSHAL